MSTRFTNYLRKKRENPEFRKLEKIAEIAAELRIQISDSGLNQHQLAEKLGMSDQALSKKLSGSANLSIGALFDLFDAMDKNFDLVVSNKGAVHVSNQQTLVMTEPPYDTIGQTFTLRPQENMASMNMFSGKAANDGWGILSIGRAP